MLIDQFIDKYYYIHSGPIRWLLFVNELGSSAKSIMLVSLL